MSPTFQKKLLPISATFSCSLALSLFMLGGDTITIAAPKVLNPGGLRPSAKASPSDAAAFQMVIPAELQQKVTVKPCWQPLSKQLRSLQDAAGVPLTRAPSVPDDPVLIAASARAEFSLLARCGCC